jgi:hypothetical protein
MPRQIERRVEASAVQRVKILDQKVVVTMALLLSCVRFAEKVMAAEIIYSDIDDIQDHLAALDAAMIEGSAQ